MIEIQNEQLVTLAEAMSRFARQEGNAAGPEVRTGRERDHAISQAERSLANDGI